MRYAENESYWICFLVIPTINDGVSAQHALLFCLQHHENTVVVTKLGIKGQPHGSEDVSCTQGIFSVTNVSLKTSLSEQSRRCLTLIGLQFRLRDCAPFKINATTLIIGIEIGSTSLGNTLLMHRTFRTMQLIFVFKSYSPP